MFNHQHEYRKRRKYADTKIGKTTENICNIKIFNEEYGEWMALISIKNKKNIALVPQKFLRKHNFASKSLRKIMQSLWGA